MGPYHDDVAHEPGVTGIAARPFGIGARLIPGGDGEDDARIDSALQGRLELRAQRRLPAQGQVDDLGPVLHGVI
ncbi:hypothetical protein D3C86_1815360 [compost metagenome]